MEFKVSVAGVAFVFLMHCFSEVTASKKLIVVLVDGVRWDYLDDKNLKGFHRIMEKGSRAPYVNPIFPSLSYPNWETLVTGLYPESHGFVSNNIYDNTTGSVFEMMPSPGSDDVRWWNDAEPIWITAEKNNKKSAMYWWAGCEVEIRGSHPSICERWSSNYDGPPSKETKADFLERIEDVVQMFKPSKKFLADRLSLVLMYYTSVDYAGHHHGPKSSAVTEALQDIDEILSKMQQKIKDAHLEDEVNIMVVSDHGMTDVRENVVRHIDLKKYADKIKLQLDFGAVSGIVPQPGMLNKLVQEIAADKIEGLRIYKKEDIPEKYHLKDNNKTAPLFLIARKGYFISSLSGAKLQGHHGFDPEEVEDMRTIFLASGPAFRKGHITEPLSTIDMYNVMCHVLEIPPLPNNGSWARVQSMFTKEKTQSPNSVSITSVASVPRSSIYFICSIFIIYTSVFTLMSFRVL
ncbi:Ectonucleotide pyrophosphatase/phosphodiesterase family member 6 [Araneus ventricosus]|uniref:glycerophosphocholine cholinephosphodiesterase n=1 Tax=Araneus ventricosus TaxID=182803 RepID=A0A4Y2NSY2_ARAVE|nr:Ectonucleotide pyrophosphatase/phosphodiesterase family member 6 [Araneus ventricosus]